MADESKRVVGQTNLDLTEGEICRALENARHYDKPFRLSSDKDNFYGRSSEKGMPAKDLVQAPDYRGTLRLVIACAPSTSNQTETTCPCPMQCGAAYLQPFLPLHTALVCPLSLVPCPNKHGGCQEMMQRRLAYHHATEVCGFRGAVAGLQQLQAQVASLNKQAAMLSAAMDELPSRLEREREASAENQISALPPNLVAQARASLEDKEWARLTWQRRYSTSIRLYDDRVHLVFFNLSPPLTFVYAV